MKTPWEKHYSEEHGPDAEFIAWQQWIVENDTEDCTEGIDLVTDIFLYRMFIEAVEYAYNSMKTGDFRTAKGDYIADPQNGILNLHNDKSA